jgi:16S rRNA (cytidine1402-2'-O)-methyltransferase
LDKGKLYIVPTPIGNLEDITLRGINVLKEADIILAEDTRVSAFLLKHLGIEKRMYAYHQHNEHRALTGLMKDLSGGMTMALISDAGTPSISDPGFLLVRECLKNEIKVECLPGPTAFVPALVNSGLPSDRFCFEGFLPVKKGRMTRMNELAEEKRTMIFYEAPHRLLKTLNELAASMGSDRMASVSKELTKMFEETINGTLETVIEKLNNKTIKGEFVIVVEGKK